MLGMRLFNLHHFVALSFQPQERSNPFKVPQVMVPAIRSQLRIGIVQLSTAEKAMALHSSTLAWKIPWTEESGRLQSMRSLRVGHD